MERFFRKIFSSLTPGGLLILEPQPFSSYQGLSKFGWSSKREKECKLRPDEFYQFLTTQVGFQSGLILGQEIMGKEKEVSPTSDRVSSEGLETFRMEIAHEGSNNFNMESSRGKLALDGFLDGSFHERKLYGFYK